MENEQVEILKKIDNRLKKLNSPPLWRYFVQGMMTGLGTVIGATILIALLLAVLRPLVATPVVGDYVKDIVEAVDTKTSK